MIAAFCLRAEMRKEKDMDKQTRGVGGRSAEAIEDLAAGQAQRGTRQVPRPALSASAPSKAVWPKSHTRAGLRALGVFPSPLRRPGLA